MRPRDWTNNDDELLAQISDALTPERVEAADAFASPAVVDRLRQAGRAAFAWRGALSEIEVLTSAPDALVGPGLATRDASVGSRVLEFQGSRLGLELDIQARTLVGQIFPTGSGDVTVLGPTGVLAAAETNDAGCFLVDRPQRGPFRIRFQSTTDDVITDWMVLD